MILGPLVPAQATCSGRFAARQRGLPGVAGYRRQQSNLAAVRCYARARLLAFSLCFHLRQARVVVGDFLEVGQGNLGGQNRVIVRHIGLGIV